MKSYKWELGYQLNFLFLIKEILLETTPLARQLLSKIKQKAQIEQMN